MDLINRERKVYGPPSNLVASDPEWDLKVSWGGSQRDCLSRFFVRKARISRTFATKQGKGGTYRLCQFPGGRAMYVNEKNIVELGQEAA